MTTNPPNIEDMAQKLDFAAIEQYAQAYAKKLCDDCFATKEKIGGQELLNLSPVAQVNLFVVQDLFERWKTETAGFRSPFFDYDHAEVKAALQTFMNTVSQYIAVNRENYEPLLAKASINTLVLALHPHQYFDGILRDQPDFVLTAEALKSMDKYTRLNQIISHGLVERMGEEPQVYVSQAVSWLNEICVNDDLFDNPDTTLAQFSETLPVTAEGLLKQLAQNNDLVKNGSFFDQITPAEPSAPKTITEVLPSIPVEPIQAIEKPIEVLSPEPVAVEPVVVASEVVEEAETLNEKLAAEAPSLNDSFKKNTPTFGNTNGRLTSVSEGISLHIQFRFIKNLFHDDTEAYHHAMRELDQCDTLEDAKELMNRKYAPQYLWRMSADDADTLFDIVKRRFS